MTPVSSTTPTSGGTTTSPATRIRTRTTTSRWRGPRCHERSGLAPAVHPHLIPDGDPSRLDSRAVDAQAGLALRRDRAQDRGISPGRGRVDGDDGASLVAGVDPQPQVADAQHSADPRVLG